MGSPRGGMPAPRLAEVTSGEAMDREGLGVLLLPVPTPLEAEGVAMAASWLPGVELGRVAAAVIGSPPMLLSVNEG